MSQIQERRGFTLIELLVVIAVISLVSSIILTSLNSAREAARDATRITDMRALNTAVYAYLAQNGRVPYGPGGGHQGSLVGAACGTNPTAQDWNVALAALVSGGFIRALPKDPGSECYVYSSYSPEVPSALMCGGESINNFHYVLSFQTERTQSLFLPGNGGTRRYCIPGPRR